LLEALDRRLRLTAGVAAAILEARDARYVVHTGLDHAWQRVFGLALGYEDCKDARGLGTTRC
jgi:ligand-binding sensor domain-containing protein